MTQRMTRQRLSTVCPACNKAAYGPEDQRTRKVSRVIYPARICQHCQAALDAREVEEPPDLFGVQQTVVRYVQREPGAVVLQYYRGARMPSDPRKWWWSGRACWDAGGPLEAALRYCEDTLASRVHWVRFSVMRPISPDRLEWQDIMDVWIGPRADPVWGLAQAALADWQAVPMLYDYLTEHRARLGPPLVEWL